MECLSCNAVTYSNLRTFFLPFIVPNWELRKEKESTLDVEELLKSFIGVETIPANCSNCNQKNIIFKRRQRMVNFPKYLIVILQRFVYDWNPIKLDTQFMFPLNNLNLEVLSTEHKVSNEKVIEVKEEENKVGSDEEDYPVNASALNTLISNGVPETSAKQALFNTGNSSVDDALDWFYMNLENPHLNDPLPKIKKQKGGFQVNNEHLETLKSFGYDENKSRYALKKCNNNFDQALEMFFTNPDFEVLGIFKIK